MISQCILVVLYYTIAGHILPWRNWVIVANGLVWERKQQQPSDDELKQNLPRYFSHLWKRALIAPQHACTSCTLPWPLPWTCSKDSLISPFNQCPARAIAHSRPLFVDLGFFCLWHSRRKRLEQRVAGRRKQAWIQKM